VTERSDAFFDDLRSLLLDLPRRLAEELRRVAPPRASEASFTPPPEAAPYLFPEGGASRSGRFPAGSPSMAEAGGDDVLSAALNVGKLAGGPLGDLARRFEHDWKLAQSVVRLMKAMQGRQAAAPDDAAGDDAIPLSEADVIQPAAGPEAIDAEWEVAPARPPQLDYRPSSAAPPEEEPEPPPAAPPSGLSDAERAELRARFGKYAEEIERNMQEQAASDETPDESDAAPANAAVPDTDIDAGTAGGEGADRLEGVLDRLDDTLDKFADSADQLQTAVQDIGHSGGGHGGQNGNMPQGEGGEGEDFESAEGLGETLTAGGEEAALAAL
jgi:hypothetical protein